MLDYRTGSIQRFTGEARIEQTRFIEEGELDVDAGRFVSRRTYHLNSDGRLLSVRFARGADFITLRERASQAVRHDCGADIYRGRFFFRDSEHWAEFWRVTGPRKDYRSLAYFSRVDLRSSASNAVPLNADKTYG